jgi:hypothetical protein
MRPLHEESIAPLYRQVPRVLLFKGFWKRNRTLSLRLAVIERKARWQGRVMVVVTAEVRS